MKKILIVIGIILLGLALYAYSVLLSSNTKVTKEKAFVYIPTGSDYQRLLQIVKDSNFLENVQSFDKLAHQLNLPQSVKPGKYQIKEGMGNYSLVTMFKGGRQTPVKLVINKLRTKQDIVKKICNQLEVDSNELRALLSDTAFLSKYEIDSNQVQALIMPDTYQFYWNSDARKVIEKIAKNYQKYWIDERKHKASALNLKPAEVITLASIVEEETNIEEDKLKIASTYLNRIRIGMPLQADPTLKFAVNDFTLKRLLTIHTQKQSPYNTYINKGLPPGPICTPNTSTIEAVLNAPKTDYLYFCAREDFKGYSNFAATYEEHQANAKKYQEALNARKIMK